ncbi:MAG: hypothetical protein FWG05_00745, partial [Kiritimatiellaeota bacterium]|nr:hypothetical protein [Kiritimatiellota bacterium]
MKKLILSLCASALVAASVSATNYTFTNATGYINDSWNWDPPAPAHNAWQGEDTATITNATASINPYAGNNILGSDGNRPEIIIGKGGVLYRENSGGTDNIVNNIRLKGGTVHFDRGMNIYGWLEVTEAPGTYLLNDGGGTWHGALYGDTNLTITGWAPDTTSAWDHGPRFSADSPGFTGDVFLNTRIYSWGRWDGVRNKWIAEQLGTGALTIGENGILDIGSEHYTRESYDTIIAGGSLRTYGGHNFWG